MSKEKSLTVMTDVARRLLYQTPKNNGTGFKSSRVLTEAQEFFLAIRQMYDNGYAFHFPKTKDIDSTGGIKEYLVKKRVGPGSNCRYLIENSIHCHPISCPFSQNRLYSNNPYKRTKSPLKKECCFPFIANERSFHDNILTPEEPILPPIAEGPGGTQINLVYIENLNIDKL